MGWSAPVLTTDAVMIKGQKDSRQVSTIGIDIGETSFHFVGFDARGGIVVRRRCSRTQLVRALANVGRCSRRSGVRAIPTHVEKLRFHQRVEDDPARRSVDAAETLDLVNREPHIWHLQILSADSLEQVVRRRCLHL